MQAANPTFTGTASATSAPFATAHIAEFSSRKKTGMLRALGILALIAGEAALIVGIASPYFRDSQARIGSIVIGASAALIGLVFFEAGQRYRQVFVRLFAEGFAITRDHKETSVRWPDVTTIYQAVTKNYYNGVYTGTTYNYTLHTRDGKKHVFNNTIKNIADLGNALQNGVTNALLPGVMQAFNSGQSVQFGPVAVSPLSLSKGPQQVDWINIDKVSVDKGYLKVWERGKRRATFSAPVKAIPNLLVCLEIIDRRVGLSDPKAKRAK